MIMSFLALTLLSQTAGTCVDHSTYDFDLAGARLRDVTIERSEPGGREERGVFPDGTVVTVSADYCQGPAEIRMAANAPLDGQTRMRLGQLLGRLDVIAGCSTNDFSVQDASLDAATAAVEAGGSWNNDGAPIGGEGVAVVTLSIRVEDGRVVSDFSCTRPVG